MVEQFSLAKWLTVGLVVAVLLNGVSHYSKRTGLVEQEAYHAYWGNHCLWDGDELLLRDEARCAEYALHATSPVNASDWHGPAESYGHYVYRVSAAERPLKMAKDLFGLTLVLISLWALAKRHTALPRVQELGPLVLLALYCGIAFLISVFLNHPLIAAAGLRSFVFLPVAFLGRWMAPHLPVLAVGMGVLIVLQVALVPLELVRGIHLFHEWSGFSLASRVAGSLVQPNSLGIFAVSALAFCHCFLASRAWMAPLAIMTFTLVLLSGSATGLACLGLFAVILLYRRFVGRAALAVWPAGVALLVAMAFALPEILARPDLFESITGDKGRWAALRSAVADHSWLEVLLGRGLGVDSNVALNLAAHHSSSVPPVAAIPADSTVTGLLRQIGVVGTVLFYGTLLWAGLRDRAASIFYGALALCSLTINVTELFPLNLLLGVVLARSSQGPNDRPHA